MNTGNKCVRGDATICVAVGERLCSEDLWDILQALVHINARTYSLGLASPPWELRWAPDLLYSTTVTMPDARVLARRGEGSCHALAAAYAGWLIANGRDASIEVLDTGPRDWHVVAVADGEVFDPMDIGGV